MKQNNTDLAYSKASSKKKKKGTNAFKQEEKVNEIELILTTFIGNFVVFEIFRHKDCSSIDIALVRIVKQGFLAKIMNFAAAEEKRQINKERKKGKGKSGEQNTSNPSHNNNI